MSEHILEIHGGPLTTNRITVIRYCCDESVTRNKLASSRKSINLKIDNSGVLGYNQINLTYNQAVILANSILRSLGQNAKT